MDENSRTAAANMVELIRELIQQELVKEDNTATCQIMACNSDGSYDITVLPDEITLIKSVKSITPENLKQGDYAYVYKFKNKLSNAIIFTRIGGQGDDVRFVTTGEYDKTGGYSGGGGGGGGSGTVTEVHAGTGLIISGDPTVEPTININPNYKLPTSGEWESALENQKVKAKLNGTDVTFGANDVVELVAGTNITLTPNATNKTITIAASGIIEDKYQSPDFNSGLKISTAYGTGLGALYVPDASTSQKGVLKIGSGATDAAAGNHKHDDRYLQLTGGALSGPLIFHNANYTQDDNYISLEHENNSDYLLINAGDLRLDVSDIDSLSIKFDASQLDFHSDEDDHVTVMRSANGLVLATTGSNVYIGSKSADNVVATRGWVSSNDKYHTTGTWSGLTYTATANGGAGALAFTIPTGTTSTTVARGDHNHDGRYLKLTGNDANTPITGDVYFSGDRTISVNGELILQSTNGGDGVVIEGANGPISITSTKTYYANLYTDNLTSNLDYYFPNDTPASGSSGLTLATREWVLSSMTVDTNQKIKTSTVTFGADDVVEFVNGGNVTITGNATAKTMTLGVATGYSIPSTTKQGEWDAKYDLPAGGIPSSDVAFNYAGSSSKGGAATSALKLSNTTKIGDTNQPVYFTNGGVPAAISYTIEKSVPSNAAFTDTATAADNILDGSNSGTQITYAPYAAATATSTWVGTNANAGKLYLGTVDPVKTTRLNYNGYFYATQLQSGEAIVYNSSDDSTLSVTVDEDNASFTVYDGDEGHITYLLPTSGTSQAGSFTLATQTWVSGRYIPKTLTTTKGDIIYASAANTPARLGIGTEGQVLKVGSSGVPVWSTDSNSNQTVKGNGTAFGANDAIDIVGSGIVSVTANTTNKTITISASHQGIKSLDTTATSAQSTSASEAIAGSGTIKLHKVAKTGTYSDLIGTPTIPTVNNGKLSIQGNGTTASEFTANSSTDVTLNIKGGGITTVTKSANNEITISSTEADTLATVTGRGATTSVRSTFSGGIIVGTSGSGDGIDMIGYDGSVAYLTPGGEGDFIMQISNAPGASIPKYTNVYFENTGGSEEVVAYQSWVSTNYLGKTAKAADSDKLDNHDSTYFLDTSATAQTKTGNLTLSGTTDVSSGTLKLKTINAPTASGGTTFGPGTSGQVLKSNGTTVYWATDTNSNQTVKTSSVTFGANDVVQITAGSNITVTGDATAKTITIAGTANTASAVDNILDGSNSGTAITYAPYASATATSTWVNTDANAGKLYLGTVDPVKTTRLNYNGYFYATRLQSGEAIVYNSSDDSTLSVTVDEDNASFTVYDGDEGHITYLLPTSGASQAGSFTLATQTWVSGRYIPKSLTTTKGDIIYASAANTPARLGIGTEGQVLKVNSSGVPEWSSDSNTNYYHSTGTWSGLTYTATANGGAPALAFTIPTGTTSTTVARGDHTHSNYQPKDADLTAIAGLTGTYGFLKKTGADAWKLEPSPIIQDSDYISFLQTDDREEEVSLHRLTIGGSASTNASYNILKLLGSNVTTTIPTGIAFNNYIIASDSATNDTNYRYFKLPTVSAGTYTIATREWVSYNVPKLQANTVVVGNALTNVSGKALSSYTAQETTITISGVAYPVIKILKNNAILSQTDAKTYMKAQTGSEFLPVYDYDQPTYTYFVFADGRFYKVQYDTTNGLVLWYLNKIALGNYLPLTGGTMTGAIILNNQVAIKAKDTNGTAYDVLNSSSGNNLIINSGRLGDTLIQTNFRPTSSYGGAIDLGSSSYPWRALYATTVYENGTSLANKYIAKSLTTTKGDIIYASAANTPARLGIGTQGQVLKVGSSGVPEWAADSNSNQTVKTSSVTFGANDAVQITAGSNITVTGDATAKTITIAGKAGTVTSVGLRNGSTSQGTLTITGSPITSSGTIDITLANGYGDTKNPYSSKAANKVLAGPASGSAAAPSFRSLVAADIPNLYVRFDTNAQGLTDTQKTNARTNIGAGIPIEIVDLTALA